MPRTVAFVVIQLCVVLSVAGAEQLPFPAGTAQFFRIYPATAIPAAGGGVWLSLPEGIVRYTAAGRGTVLATPGGAPFRLALASDGSIWFANGLGVGRVSAAGNLLEQHALTNVGEIAVASDGAVWYTRAFGSVVGRIAAGSPTEFVSPTQAWSLAAAADGAVWILGTGFATATDSLYRMSTTGAVSVLALNADVLYGRLQTIPNGTLYISTGINHEMFRLPPVSGEVSKVAGVSDEAFLVDDGGNIWSASSSILKYLASDETVRFKVQLPYDPRSFCSTAPYWAYRPLAVDATGGLWLRVINDRMYLPEPLPCDEPEPPEMPTLVRLDIATLFATQSSINVPTLSRTMLVIVLAAISVIGLLRSRTP